MKEKEHDIDQPLKRLPGRDPSPEELDVMKALKEAEDRREENKKIRCPCCKKNQYFDSYLANKQIGTLVCSICGVLFIDKAKLKLIKANLTAEKVKAHTISRSL